VTDPAAGGQRILDDASRSAVRKGTAQPLVIAVDGPAGSGKSTAARGVAVALGLRYLDTGAMYRALTWWLLNRGVDITDEASVAGLADRPRIEISTDPARQVVSVDGVDVTAQIRSRAVTSAVSAVARVPDVRRHIIAQQRQIIASAADGPGIVADGRDVGRVVAPHAAVKVFLTAREQVRAQRRSAELAAGPAADPAVTAEQTRREQARRDRLDAPQTERAADAVEIESSELPLADVVARIVGLAAQRAGRAGRR
jgi:CMP/dCMP kinase